VNANPWKDPLYRLIDEYGGLAIPKGEREEWREVIPLGLRRKYRDARQPDAFVQACLEDGRCQEYGIRDTRDLHDALTIRLPTHRMGAGLRLQTEADVGDDEAEESPAWRRIREMSTVVGAEVPRGRPHRVTVYETSPVLWQRSEQSRSRRAGVAVNPMHPGEMARAYRGYWLYSDITGRLWFAKKHNTVVATGTSLEQVRAAVDSIFGFKANYPPGWGSRSVASARRRSALRQAEAFRTRDIVPGLLPTRIPAKAEQDRDLLKGFRQPEPEKQMRMFNPYELQFWQGSTRLGTGQHSTLADAKRHALGRLMGAPSVTARIFEPGRDRVHVLRPGDRKWTSGPFATVTRVSNPCRSNGHRNPKVGQTVGVAGRWLQEWYEPKDPDLRKRAKELRAQGWHVSVANMGSQVTDVGRLRMSLLRARREQATPAVQHSPVWRKGFTAGIAAKARGAVQGNPMSRVRTETVARQIAAERGVSYGLSVFDGWYYVGTLKELAAVGAVRRNPLTRRETAEVIVRGRSNRKWQDYWSRRDPVAHALSSGRVLEDDYIVGRYGDHPAFEKRNPLTRGETALVVRQSRKEAKLAKRMRDPENRGLMIGAAQRGMEIALSHGALRPKTFLRAPFWANPRVVGRAGKSPAFNGTHAQAMAYARAHGLGTPYQVGIRKGARV